MHNGEGAVVNIMPLGLGERQGSQYRRRYISAASSREVQGVCVQQCDIAWRGVHL